MADKQTVPRSTIQIAAAVMRQADKLDESAHHIESTATRIGLPQISAARAVFDLRQEADLLRAGWRLIVDMLPAAGA